MSPGPESDFAHATRGSGSWRRMRHGLGPRRVRLREKPNPWSSWSELWRRKSPREHGPGVLALARVGIVARTGLPGGARLRSGRGGRSPASHGVDETEGRGRRVKARTTGPPSGSKEPSSRPLRPASPHGRAEAKGRRGGESDREPSITSRRPRSRREPARKQRPARAGTAPRKVKALKGISRDASGMKQGREASGASRRAAGSGQELERAVHAARTVERGKNPEDGTGEGTASLAFREGVSASSRRQGHPA